MWLTQVSLNLAQILSSLAIVSGGCQFDSNTSPILLLLVEVPSELGLFRPQYARRLSFLLSVSRSRSSALLFGRRTGANVNPLVKSLVSSPDSLYSVSLIKISLSKWEQCVRQVFFFLHLRRWLAGILPPPRSFPVFLRGLGLCLGRPDLLVWSHSACLAVLGWSCEARIGGLWRADAFRPSRPFWMVRLAVS